MSSAEKIAAGLAALVAGVIIYLELSRRGMLRIKLDTGVDVSDSDSPWLSQPSDQASTLRRRHPLYRRPDVSRPAHRRLCQSGWGAWYLDPPSESAW